MGGGGGRGRPPARQPRIRHERSGPGAAARRPRRHPAGPKEVGLLSSVLALVGNREVSVEGRIGPARGRDSRHLADPPMNDPAPNDNLFVALRAGFPADLDRAAIETVGEETLVYTWRDLERATAMLANLLASLDLPAGARVAVQVDKSVEALLLYLAVLRAGLVYLPLNTAYKADELEYFIGDAEPAVVVCASRDFGWLSKLAFGKGTGMGLHPRRRPARQPARAGCAVRRPPHAGRPRPGRPRRHPLHQRHDRAQQGRDAVAREPALERAHAQGLLGLARPGPKAATS